MPKQNLRDDFILLSISELYRNYKSVFPNSFDVDLFLILKMCRICRWSLSLKDQRHLQLYIIALNILIVTKRKQMSSHIFRKEFVYYLNLIVELISSICDRIEINIGGEESLID